MAPIDAKLEAQRLKDAKKALRKMWRKRSSSDTQRGEESPSSSNSTGTLQESLIDMKRVHVIRSKDRQEETSNSKPKQKKMKTVVGSKSIKSVHGEKSRRGKRSPKLTNTGLSTADMYATDDFIPLGKDNYAKIKDDTNVKALKNFASEEMSTKNKSTKPCVALNVDAAFKIPKILKKRVSKQKLPKVNSWSVCSNAAELHGKNKTLQMPCPQVPLTVRMPSFTVHCPLPDIPQEVDDNEDSCAGSIFNSVNSESDFCITSGDECVLPDIEENESYNVETDQEVVWMDEGEENSVDTQCQAASITTHSVEFHYIDRSVILHLRHPATLFFNGLLEVEVIQGGVEILGFSLTSGQGSKTVYSPRGSSLLSLQSIEVVQEGGLRSKLLQELDGSRLEALLQSGSTDDCWLLLSKVESKIPQFVERYISHPLFPQPTSAERDHPYWKAGRKLRCIFGATSGNKVFRKGDKWDECAERIANQEDGCSVLCGGKGVGKSTLLRYLVNRLLSGNSPAPTGVVLIDLDPGQAELTPPGCISLSLVQQPLLGPNYTHFQEPERCFFLGDVNVANCASRYISACKMLVEYWQSQPRLRGLPCLVNTMGFNKGLGVTLISQILSLLRPTLVVQIQSRSANRNFPQLLSANFIQRNTLQAPRLSCGQQSLFTSGVSPNRCTTTHELVSLDSAAEAKTNKTEWGLDAKSMREIAILSYFSQASSPPNFTILDIVPYSCPFDSLYLCVSHEPVPPSLVLTALNGSLVGLCYNDPTQEVILSTEPGMPSILSRPPLAPCLGYGIVRGMDMESKQLYLITPLRLEELNSVNCLIMGAIATPPSFMLTPPAGPGQVPFVVVGMSQQTSRPSKRLYRPTWQDVKK